MLINHIQNPSAPSDYRVPRGVFQMLCGVWLLEFTGLNGENSFYAFNWGEESNCGRCRAIFDGMRLGSVTPDSLVGFDFKRLLGGGVLAVATSLPGIGDTISKFKGPISQAAGKVADHYMPGSGKVVASMWSSAIPDPKNPQAQQQAQQHLEVVQHAATVDANAADQLSHAQETVTNTAIAYHMAHLQQQAQAGDRTAQTKITAVQQRAVAGDPIAQLAIKALHLHVSAEPPQGRGMLDAIRSARSVRQRS